MSELRLQIEDQQLIGENNHGYQFAVGKLEKRWIGFAIGRDEESGKGFLFVFPDIESDGYLGVGTKCYAILLASAIADDPESGYGGVDRWFIEESMRGKPEDLRCEKCECIGCDGYCDDFDPIEFVP